MNECKRRILVADDDQLLRTLAADILSEKYDVMQAIDGQDALEKALAWRPELVVTDIMMPRMHGYELCERLKGRNGISGVFVIVTSSKSFSTDKAQAKEAGADGYIVKPFASAELLDMAADLFAKSRSAAATSPMTEPIAPAEVLNIAAPEYAPVSTSPLPVYVRFWGTRGSCPTGGVNTVRYGGNTSCTEVRIGNLLLIIDCGTGLRELGSAIAQEFEKKPVEGHIFVGHTHWDHIQGFPFFVPLYNSLNTFKIYSVRGAHSSLKGVFSGSMALDYFPIPLSSLSGKVSFIEMAGPVDLGVAKVSFHYLNHPGVCIGFRIEAQGRVITYLSDHEDFRRLSGSSDMAIRQEAAVAAFAQNSDLLIREAQYTEEEYLSRKGWGHSTFDDAVRFAIDTKAKRLAIFHHDPDHTDTIMDAHIKYCKELVVKAGAAINCFAAWDGLRVDL
ncbi:MAG TPA: hypothetical protein DCL44_03640 [Elusimicrobia bacterium]|nr:hypothetical protein [Elusimicrobiota bacterium]